MKQFYFILFLTLLTSCNKDKVEPNGNSSFSSCAFSSTNTSFSQLDLAQTNNSDLYFLELNVSDDVNGMVFDLNCDGIGDLRIDGNSDQDWFCQTSTASSDLTLTPLNQNTYILSDSRIDSTFQLSSVDTSGTSIQDYQLVSSYSVTGSILTQTNTNFYCSSQDSTTTVWANDSRWVSSPQVIRDHYKSTTTYYFGSDQNGYSHDISDIQEFNRGIIPNYQVSWIPIKFITNDGNVKLGYLKLRPSLYLGFVNAGLAGWAIQR